MFKTVTNEEQAQIDNLVDRTRKLVEKYGGQSDELKQVRTYYSMFERFPEWVSFVFWEAEVKKLEKEQP